MNFIALYLTEIEFILLGAIAVGQIIAFVFTLRRISSFANIFSRTFTLEIGEESLDKVKGYDKIIAHINQSALRKGSFNLVEVRRVTEEYLDRQEDAINRSVTVPLYLGLMGTILGIILGLFAYGGNTAVENIDDIDKIINAVKFAMIVSFLGLALTVINQTRIFNRAKAKVEEGKQDFYKFLNNFDSFDNELSLVVNQMTVGLNDFNSKFGENLEEMSFVINATEKIKDWNFDSLVKAVDKFKHVEKYLNNIKTLLDKVEAQETTLNNVKTLQETTDSLDNNITIFAEATLEVKNDIAQMTASIMQMTDKIADSVVGNGRVLKELFDYFNSDKFAETQNRIVEESKKVTDVIIATLSEQQKCIENMEVDARNVQKEAKIILEDAQIELTKTADNLKTTDVDFVEKFVKNAKIRSEDWDNLITQTNNEIVAAFSKLAKDLDLKGVTREEVLNNVVMGEITNVSKSIAESFGEIQKSMEQWKSKLAESVKADAIKDTKAQDTKLDQMVQKLDYQQQLLERICENTKPRSFWGLLKNFVGISR